LPPCSRSVACFLLLLLLLLLACFVHMLFTTAEVRA
jgi:hypothetical protein